MGLFKRISIALLLFTNLCLLAALAFNVAMDEKQASSFGSICDKTIAQKNDTMMDSVIYTNIIYVSILLLVITGRNAKRAKKPSTKK